MRYRKLINLALVLCCIISVQWLNAQQSKQENQLQIFSSKFGNELRGKNAVSLALGSSIMNGDLADPIFEIYFHGGYKRFIGSHVNVNFIYHKFNLAFKDQFNEGFMSFDLNLELNMMPYKTFNPFVYAGGGLNASNYFKRTDSKIQGGGGIEYLVTTGVGLKLFAEYNHVFTDELDGIITGQAEDIYWRLGFGLNLYFGRRLINTKYSDIPTVIKSNPLVDDY